MQCQQCGHPVQEQDRYCSHCGEIVLALDPESTRVMAAVPGSEEAAVPTVELETPALEHGDVVLIIHKGGSDKSIIRLDQESTTAGRHPKCDIFLDDISVSRHHLRFVYKDDQLLLEDLGSMNGTYLNRERIDSPRVLHDGDQIHIGKYRAYLRMGRIGSK
ncbi:MAG: histidine kinase [Arachnia propionica]|nr:MAG: histidine kinase [Arachnia propionica]